MLAIMLKVPAYRWLKTEGQQGKPPVYVAESYARLLRGDIKRDQV
jgi:hypothetical protein